MNGKWVLSAFLIALLIVLLFVGVYSYLNTVLEASRQAPDVFVGVDAAYDNMTSLKERIDQVKAYTNFFIVGSTGITLNETRLNDICQYLNDSGLNFATFTHTVQNTTIQFNQSEWTSLCKTEIWKRVFRIIHL